MIHARETIACPMILLADMLLAEPPRWLSSFLRLSCMEGEEAAARTYGDTITARPRPGAKAASVDLGSAGTHEDGETVVIPIRWKVQGYRILPGKFDGRLELTPGPGSTTEVELSGTWPLDPREHADFSTRLAARAAAEASIQRLLANVRIALEEAARDTA